jgi:hypothetical protein
MLPALGKQLITGQWISGIIAKRPAGHLAMSDKAMAAMTASASVNNAALTRMVLNIMWAPMEKGKISDKQLFIHNQ